MRIRNVTRRTELASEAHTARGFIPRLVGLLGRASLNDGEGLIIDPCSSVHTAFMRFSIDVVYVDGEGRVAKACPDLKPFRFSAVLRGAKSVVELPTGTIDRTGTASGDQLTFES